MHPVKRLNIVKHFQQIIFMIIYGGGHVLIKKMNIQVHQHFSGILVDLNVYLIRMNGKFYLQQRFFSLIELAHGPFAPGKVAVNVIAINGMLGLTSHHCIHGNYLNNI